METRARENETMGKFSKSAEGEFNNSGAHHDKRTEGNLSDLVGLARVEENALRACSL